MNLKKLTTKPVPKTIVILFVSILIAIMGAEILVLLPNMTIIPEDYKAFVSMIIGALLGMILYYTIDLKIK